MNKLAFKKLLSGKSQLFDYWKITLMAITGFLIISGFTYLWVISQRYVSTEDAYLNGHIVQIAPRVTGLVSHLYVENNQYVKKGQILFELDAAPFQVEVDKAASQYEIDKANLQHAIVTANRAEKLVTSHVLSPQSGDDIQANLISAKAQLKRSDSQLKEANLKLSYTKVYAPSDGWVTNMTLRDGNIINASQPVFALINQAKFWVDANFKETELGQIKHQQLATIYIDMYPRQKFTGIVKSISSVSGTALSLMPPQNATGNWVKVTQRVPVRVELINPDPKYPIRLGTSAKVTIDLNSKA